MMACQAMSMFLHEPKRLIFTPIEHMYIQELERITTWVRMGYDEKQWASTVRLVGLLDLQWRAPHHDLFVEFLNIYQIKGKTIYVKMGEKNVAIDKHLNVDVFKISDKGWKKQKQANK